MDFIGSMNVNVAWLLSPKMDQMNYTKFIIIIIIIIGHFRAPFLKKSSRRFTTLSIGSLKYYIIIFPAVIPFIKNFHP